MTKIHDRLERIPLAELIPYARNSRTHSEAQVAQIAASIREFGFTNPVLIDEQGGIVAGHGRVAAARVLGMDVVPCLRLEGLTAAQRRAYVIADNRIALNAGWDFDMLAVELRELSDEDFELSVLGFDDGEIEKILAVADATIDGNTDPDDVPDAPAEPVTKPGDVWVLGRHRIVCGDCTDALVVEKLLGDVRPHLMVTDPPYGVEYDPAWREKAGVAGPGTAKGKVLNDDKADWRDAWALFPGEVAYVWHSLGPLQIKVFESLVASGFEIRTQIIWVKSSFVIGRGHYHCQHEPCWYAVRKGGTGHWAGDRKQSTVWDIPRPQKSETGHSTQKPVECMRRPIQNNSSPGQAIYEPFSGSGTTIIACEMTGRHCYAIELNPSYVDVAVQRWQAFTGKAATLEATGKPFPNNNNPEATDGQPTDQVADGPRAHDPPGDRADGAAAAVRAVPAGPG